jgi:hypothetical protein
VHELAAEHSRDVTCTSYQSIAAYGVLPQNANGRVADTEWRNVLFRSKSGHGGKMKKKLKVVDNNAGSHYQLRNSTARMRDRRQRYQSQTRCCYVH